MASKALIRAVQKNVRNFIRSQSHPHASFVHSQRMSTKTFSFTSNRFETYSKNKIHSVASISAVPKPPKANPKKTMSNKYSNSNCVTTAVLNDGNININDSPDLVTFGVVYATLGFILCKFL
eukprot:UN02520